MIVERKMTLQEFMKSDWYDHDEVEIHFHGQWLPLGNVQESYVNRGTWYPVAEGELYVVIDDKDHMLEGYETIYQIRCDVSDEDIDNPHIPEDDFNYPCSESIADTTSYGYFELMVEYQAFNDSVMEFTVILNNRTGAIGIDTFNSHDDPETAELYDLSSRSWNMSLVNEFWDSLVCLQ